MSLAKEAGFIVPLGLLLLDTGIQIVQGCIFFVGKIYVSLK